MKKALLAASPALSPLTTTCGARTMNMAEQLALFDALCKPPDSKPVKAIPPGGRRRGRPHDKKWVLIAAAYYGFRVLGTSHGAAVSRIQKHNPGLSKDTIERSVRTHRDKSLDA
jgi:hypothetical protein